ncbi:MAG: Potassium-transporting ATPase ATP-binding subunit [Candidatus Argoarchaeum ethanivorans]|uniref:Potassium-transporting ATPase ATP-binding subunit n=1 Tax=Candidatus Argoarchaeum ethanivorans TaxID=2608793 RepID=A0A811T9E3_9EURY|nr:MAG: Potassium-transporting ATPase ATP-binding subunit [Candidatus Argoarchaeum ethanivorans]
MRTPLQKNLDRLGRWIGTLTLLVVGLVSLLGVIRGYDAIEMFVWGVALAVAAVPEALPAVVTVGLALGVRRMVKRHALVRQLPAVETLGATTVICTDKTGTLTQNKMTVRNVYTAGRIFTITGVGYVPEGSFQHNNKTVDPAKHKTLERVLTIGALCNDSTVSKTESGWQITGDPTEGALVVAAAKAKLVKSELNSSNERVNEIPFSSERKQMTTIHDTTDGHYAYSKGAPEVILDKCTRYSTETGEKELDKETIEEILREGYGMAEQGQRVIATAYKKLQGKEADADNVESELVFVGLIGMIDPPREEAKMAIETCKNAGINTVMITGDHLLTAKAVAAELGLLNEKSMVLSGEELDEMNDYDFEKIVENIQVYARTDPSHKLRIISALQKMGHVVAMTGDGINDAPALKKADIGVAMGITGTDVSKEASDMILTDDNFASIVASVEEGRNIFKNLTNFITYGLAIHIAEVMIVLSTMLAGLPLPLIAIQILWINLVTDGLPPLTLSLEPPEKQIMNQQPRSKGEGIITPRVLFYSSLIGIIMTIQAVAIFLWYIDDLVKAQSMVFTIIVVASMFNALNWRSERQSFFTLNPLTNKPLLYAIATTVLLQLAVLYTPLASIFHTTPLNMGNWITIILLSATTLLITEVTKQIENMRNKQKIDSS